MSHRIILHIACCPDANHIEKCFGYLKQQRLHQKQFADEESLLKLSAKRFENMTQTISLHSFTAASSLF